MYASKNIVLLFLVLLCALGEGYGNVLAQKKEERSQADEFFDNYEYAKAIPLYKKSADKNDADLRKLADCYRLTKNYPEAEACYAKLVAKNSADPQVYYYYGEALLNNNKYEEAKKQFSTYSILNPGDSKGELYAKACDEIKDILVKPALYKVFNISGLNSEVSDFSPAFYKDGLVFASERVKDLVNYNDNNWTGNPYLTLIYAKESTQKAVHSRNDSTAKDSMVYEKPKVFYNAFSGDGHYGPACFNADGSEMFFTKVDAHPSVKPGGVSQPKLYWSKHGSKWSKPKLMPFSSDDYATGHPSISKDGQYLYFSSNMPGGKGGTDIWVSKREGDTWGTPQNLGPEINTKDDETFPYISANNVLYFSSNGHNGFGGLDLFSSVQKGGPVSGIWGKPNNLMPPINSTSDDFGILFRDDNSGYFSSNRPGGKGSDDLYGFSLSGLITSVSGKILLSNKSDDGAPNIKVFLLTDKGIILQTTFTDGSGFFKFENLLADQNYMIKVDESDPNLVNQKKFYLADSKNKIVRTVVKSKNGVFVFENLPTDLTKLSELVEADVSLQKISIAGNLYSGDQRSPLENAKVNLLDEKGEIVQTTTTNAFGSFVFMNIEPDKNFTIALDESDPKLAAQKIYFTNKSGKEVAVRSGGVFRFEVLASDANTLSLIKVEDSQLLVDLKGVLFADQEGKARFPNSDISLVDEKGKVVGASRTDESGNFKFINLPADKSYLVRLKEDDPFFSAKNVFLADSRGRIVATLKSSNGKFFRYSILASEEQSLASIYFDDPWLKVAKMKSEAKKDSMLTIIENIYYDYQKWELVPEAIITLNKVVGVMKTNTDITIEILSHTDSRGSEDFNLKLSQKRAQAAVDYMITKGIDKKRLSPIGKGETQLVNRCKDGVECSEEEHAQNRRTVFNVKSKAQ